MAVSTRAALRSSVMVVGVIAAAAALDGQRPGGAIPTGPDDKTIVHVLNRLGFGPAPGDVERIRQMGLEAYIDQQLNPSRNAETPVAARLTGFETLAMSTRQLAENYFLPAQMQRRQAQRAAGGAADGGDPQPTADMKPPPAPPAQNTAVQAGRRVLGELAQQRLLRAVYSERQLEEVMVDFWFNHFNVFAGKGQTRVYLTEYERDTIRPRVFGRFRELLGAVAESPGMLFYLDNWRSAAPAGSETWMPPPGRRAAGRPARRQPAQQIRRGGINENYARELMELHTLGVDGGYTQKDVQEIARAFTGWTIETPRQGGGFRFDPRMHDSGEKVVLGVTIPRGGGKKDGERVLDLLAAHPSTGRFIATKLARRFVADDPPSALVERAAGRFRESGGDIREVLRVIVTSPEFFAPAAYRSKVKTPLEFVASAVRASGVDVRNAQPLVQALRELGMPLYGCQPPTGYADRAEAWVNTGALLSRMNFAAMLSGNRLRGGAPGRQGRQALGGAVPQDRIAAEIMAGEVSDTTRQTIAKASNEAQKVALLLGSPEFQRR